jgi:hypothetical protein
MIIAELARFGKVVRADVRLRFSGTKAFSTAYSAVTIAVAMEQQHGFDERGTDPSADCHPHSR